MGADLAERRCVPCEGDTAPLAEEQIQQFLGQLKGWRIQEGKKLTKAFKFGNFVEAVGFVNAITPVAEAEGHHPDLYVRWGQVRVYLWTHAIDALSENDFILAAKIDRVYAEKRRP